MKFEKRIVRRVSAIVLGTLSITVIGLSQLVPWQKVDNIFTTTKYSHAYEKPEKQPLNPLYSKSGYVEVLHDEMNELVGWGSIALYEDHTSADWQTWYETTVAQTNYDELALIYTDAEKQQDIKQLGKIVDYVSQTHDVNALRYVHRILHDLDYFVVNIGWNATTSEHYRILASDVQGNVPTNLYTNWVTTK